MEITSRKDNCADPPCHLMQAFSNKISMTMERFNIGLYTFQHV
jgi:hypothetical protein